MAKTNFENLTDSELSIDSFSFYTSVSAVFSSKIEGEDIDLDSFVKHKKFSDIEILLKTNLTFEEVFFYAAMLHLVFLKIHPFNDGNGRTARLLEKWFIAEKLGEKAWFLQAERYYYNNHKYYYQAIRNLGLEYEMLNYTKAMPFLQLLPQSLNFKSLNN